MRKKQPGANSCSRNLKRDSKTLRPYSTVSPMAQQWRVHLGTSKLDSHASTTGLLFARKTNNSQSWSISIWRLLPHTERAEVMALVLSHCILGVGDFTSKTQGPMHVGGCSFSHTLYVQHVRESSSRTKRFYMRLAEPTR